MPSAVQLTVLAAVVGSGLTAGLCFTFASFAMTAFDRLGAPQAIRAMQSINAAILKSTAMAVWFGTAVLGVLAAVLTRGHPCAVAAAVLYAIGAVLITGRGNVPLNEALDRVDPASADAEHAWHSYRRRWNRWNAWRTLAITLATAGFALAL